MGRGLRCPYSLIEWTEARLDKTNEWRGWWQLDYSVCHSVQWELKLGPKRGAQTAVYGWWATPKQLDGWLVMNALFTSTLLLQMTTAEDQWMYLMCVITIKLWASLNGSAAMYFVIESVVDGFGSQHIVPSRYWLPLYTMDANSNSRLLAFARFDCAKVAGIIVARAALETRRWFVKNDARRPRQEIGPLKSVVCEGSRLGRCAFERVGGSLRHKRS
jgi:hypothetical protein